MRTTHAYADNTIEDILLRPRDFLVELEHRVLGAKLILSTLDTNGKSQQNRSKLLPLMDHLQNIPELHSFWGADIELVRGHQIQTTDTTPSESDTEIKQLSHVLDTLRTKIDLVWEKLDHFLEPEERKATLPEHHGEIGHNILLDETGNWTVIDVGPYGGLLLREDR